MTGLVADTTRLCLGCYGSLTLFFTVPGFVMVLRLLRFQLSWHMHVRTKSRCLRRGRRFDLRLRISSHVRIHRL
jgi:hypothetical protein